MTLLEIEKKILRAKAEKDVLVDEKRAMGGRLSQIGAECKGQRLRPADFKALNSERANLIRKKTGVEAALGDKKRLIAGLHHQHSQLKPEPDTQACPEAERLVSRGYEIILKHFLATDVQFSEKEKAVLRDMAAIHKRVQEIQIKRAKRKAVQVAEVGSEKWLLDQGVKRVRERETKITGDMV